MTYSGNGMGLAVSKIGAAFAVNAWFMVAVGASPVLAQQPKFSSPKTIPGRVCRNLQDNFVITVPDGYAATFLAEGNGGAIYRFRRSAEVEFRLIKRPARVGGAGLHRLRAEIEQRTRGHPETAGTLREWRQELPAGTARVFAYKRRVGPGTGSQQTQVVIDYAIAKGNALWLLRFPVRDFHYPQAKIRGSFFARESGNLAKTFRFVEAQARYRMGAFTHGNPTGPNWFQCAAAGSKSENRTFFTMFAPMPAQAKTAPKLPPSRFARVMTATIAAGAHDRKSLLRATARRLVGFGDSRRYRSLAFKVREAKARAGDCVRFDSLVEEKGSVRFPNIVFDLTVRGSVCLHPEDSNQLIHLIYSERIVQGTPPPPGDGAPNSFLESIGFISSSAK